MHSRIFQLNTEPISKSDYIKEWDFYDDDWFLHEIADYIKESCNRNEDIEWLKRCVHGIVFDKDEHGEYLVVESKEEYFDTRFEAFKTAIDKLNKLTFEEFMSDYGFPLWEMNTAYEDKYGFYARVSGKVTTWSDGEIYTVSEEMFSFDRFMRVCIEGQKYYIGGTIDYHC